MPQSRVFVSILSVTYSSPICTGHTQFVIIGHDGTDDKALERRLAVREKHLERARKYKITGQLVFGGAILDGEGKMIGSVMLLNDMTQGEVKKFLDDDPYVKDGVWQNYEVKPFRLAPLAPQPPPKAD